MEEEKKPVTSEEFNENLKKEKTEYTSSNVQENDKTNPIMIILIIIFILSFLAGCAFTVINLMNKDKKTNNNNTETNTVTEPTAEPEKIEELKEIDVKGYEEIILKIDFARDTASELEASKLTNQQILRIGLSDEITNKGYFTSEELKKSIKTQLGDIEYNDEPIKCLVCGNALYKYSNEEKVYEQAPSNDHGHGPAGGLYKQKYFVSAIKNDTKGTLEINYKILYGEYVDDVGSPSSNIYFNAEDAKNRTNGIVKTDEINGYEKEDFDIAYENNKNDIPVTTYSFAKDSEGNYVFKKVSVK